MDGFSLEAFAAGTLDAPMPLYVLSVGAIATWLLIAFATWRRPGHHTLILMFATVFCLLSEYLAIRLGKYQYAHFPLSLPEGIFGNWIDPLLEWASAKEIIPTLMKAPHVSRHIPVEIALIEGALLYGVFRITNLLAPLHTAQKLSFRTLIPWFAERWKNPVLNGFLALSIDSMLDPVVAGSYSLEANAGRQGLGLWIWHTNAHYDGHWFGIPLANYNAWFAALFAFTIATRIKGGSFKIGKFVLSDRMLNILTVLKAIGLMLGVAFALKFLLDYVTYEAFDIVGQPTPRWWQFTVSGALIVSGFVAFLTVVTKAQCTAPREWLTIVPVAFVFVYAFAALLLAADGTYPQRFTLLTIWVITFAIVAVHCYAPWLRRRNSAAAARGIP